jgi:hypothetical protein
MTTVTTPLAYAVTQLLDYPSRAALVFDWTCMHMLSVAGVCVGLYGDLPPSVYILMHVAANYSSHLTFRSCRAVDSFTTSTRHSVQVIFYSLSSVCPSLMLTVGVRFLQWGTFKNNIVSCILIGAAHSLLLFRHYFPFGGSYYFSTLTSRCAQHPFVASSSSSFSRAHYGASSAPSLDSSPASAAVRAPLLVWWTRPLSSSMREFKSGHGYVSTQVCAHCLSVLTSSRLYFMCIVRVGSQHRLQPVPVHARLPGGHLRRAVLRLLSLLWSRDRQAVRHFVLRPVCLASCATPSPHPRFLLFTCMQVHMRRIQPVLRCSTRSCIFAQRHCQHHRSPGERHSFQGPKAATKMAGSVGSVLPALLLGRRRTPSKSFTTSPSVVAKPHVSSSFSLHGHDERGT